MKLPDGITITDQWVSPDGQWVHLVLDIDTRIFPPRPWYHRWWDAVVRLVTLR